MTDQSKNLRKLYEKRIHDASLINSYKSIAMKFLKRVLAALLLMIFIACNHQYRSEESKTTDANLQALEKPEEIGERMDTSYAAPPPGINENKQNQPSRIDWDKKIVKNGNLTIEVKKIDEFHTVVREAIKRAGGYIAREDQNKLDYKIENTVTVKVPVDQFESVIFTLTSNQEKIIERKISSEDVTGEVVDTRSRIEAKKKVRDRYLDLLNQAKNMGEILQVESEINEVQQQIEAASGRVNYLTHAAAMSTIQITYFQIVGQQIQEDKPPGFGERMLNAFKGGANWIGEFLIFLINIWPVMLAVFLLLFAIKKIKPKAKSI